MEEEEISLLFEGGKCYEMYLRAYSKVMRFRVYKRDSAGSIWAKECGTNEEIYFSILQLLKVEYSTKHEIDCNLC